MKKTILSLAMATICFGGMAQKLKTKKFKRTVLNIPVVPVKNFNSLNLKMYTGNTGVSKATLREYIGAMKIMKSAGERYSGMNFYTHSPVTLTNERADINVEIAFGTPKHHGTVVKTGTCENAIALKADDNCKEYYYMVSYELPTAVQLTDRNGNLIDAWNYNSMMSLQFGREAYQKETSSAGKKTISMFSNRYYNEESLAQGYKSKGAELLNRKAVLLRLSAAIDDVYEKAYYFRSTDKDVIAYGSGSFEYDQLETARDESIALLEESADLSKLEQYQKVWKDELKTADYRDRKARISPKIAHGLYSNLALSYMYQQNYDSAIVYMEKVIASVPPKGVTSTSSSTSESPEERAQRLSRLIYFRSVAYKKNGSIPFNAETAHKGIDLKQQYGKRKNNAKYDFVDATDKYLLVKANADKVELEYRKLFYDLSSGAGDMAAGGNKYRKMLQLNGTNGQMLQLNAFVNKDIVGGPFPAEIGSVTEITQLVATGMKFTELPESIGNLTNMKMLNLNNSMLKEVPASIGKCESLKTLNLANNNLTTLPESIKDLKNLKSVVLKGNPISASEAKKIQGWLPPKCKLKL